MKGERHSEQEQNPVEEPQKAPPISSLPLAPDPWTGERWGIDGLEDTPRGRMARVELPDGRTLDLPLSALPEGVQEGDVLGIEDGPDGVVAHLLRQETQARRQEAEAELDALNARGAALAVNADGEITL